MEKFRKETSQEDGFGEAKHRTLWDESTKTMKDTARFIVQAMAKEHNDGRLQAFEEFFQVSSADGGCTAWYLKSHNSAG